LRLVVPLFRRLAIPFYRLSKILRHALSIGVLLPEGFLRPDITFPGLIPER